MKYPDDYMNKVICGDCLEVMKGMPDKCVDLVLTDPPYGIGFMYNEKEKATTAEEYKDFIKPFYKEFLRVTKDTSAVWMAQACKYFAHFWEWYGDDVRIFIAAKNFISMRKTYMNYSFDPWVVKVKNKYIQKTKPDNNKDYTETCTASLVSNPHNLERQHPTPRTVALMKHLVHNFSNDTDIILDPFLGSGTTAVACKELNRQYIGIEKNPEYCKIAEKRLFNTIPSMF